jgi:hypothetical protein
VTFEQSRAREHPHAVADADHGGSERRLMLQPRAKPRVVAVVHRRHDDPVGAARMVVIEGVQRRVEQDAHGRAHLDRTRFGGDGQDVGDVGAGERAEGHHEVRDLGSVVQRDDGDERSSPGAVGGRCARREQQ